MKGLVEVDGLVELVELGGLDEGCSATPALVALRTIFALTYS